jgi:hypothetical protein
MPRLTAAAGLGLRAPHVSHVLAEKPSVPWFEVHSENYFGDGGPSIGALLRVRRDYPVALHGVGMSLGSVDPLDRAHLMKLRRLVARVDPWMVSEHLCWSGIDGRSLNDLLPLPYTREALEHVCARVSEAQDLLGHAIAIENISSYVTFPESDIPESAFIAALAARTGCRLLLDVNNVYVNSVNHGFDASAFLAALPGDAIAEIHVAGFEAGEHCLIDTHGALVAPEVWSLYREAVLRFGPRPTLVEWDTDIPAFAVLQQEAARAQAIIEDCDAVVA